MANNKTQFHIAYGGEQFGFDVSKLERETFRALSQRLDELNNIR
jgi:hypothetical protein